MRTKKKGSKNYFLANLRKSLGIENQWKMAQRLDVKFSRYNMAETRGSGLPSWALLARIAQVFGWEAVAPHVKEELERIKS